MTNCKSTNIKYLENANKTYPQWDMITKEMDEKFKDFHKILRQQGYEIRSTNIAEKDNKLFWILLSDNKEDFVLEQYGYRE